MCGQCRVSALPGKRNLLVYFTQKSLAVICYIASQMAQINML